MGTFGTDANGEATSGMNHEGENTDAVPRDGTLRSSEEVGKTVLYFPMGSLGSLFTGKEQ
jgi:hypothetical protein